MLLCQDHLRRRELFNGKWYRFEICYLVICGLVDNASTANKNTGRKKASTIFFYIERKINPMEIIKCSPSDTIIKILGDRLVYSFVVSVVNLTLLKSIKQYVKYVMNKLSKSQRCRRRYLTN